MLGLFLCITAGNAVSSVLAAPFLSKSGAGHEKETRIVIPYTIIAVFSFLVVLVQLIALCVRPYKKQETNQLPEGVEDQHIGKHFWWILTVGSLLMMVTYSGNITLASFLTTFAVFSGQHVDKVTAASMFTLFVTTTGLSILAGTYVATKISAKNIIYCSLTLVLIGSSSLLWSSHESQAMMWVSLIIIGIGMGPTGPTLYSFFATYSPLTNSMICSLALCKNIANSLAMYAIGNAIETMPDTLLYFNISATILGIVIFAVLQFKLPVL